MTMLFGVLSPLQIPNFGQPSKTDKHIMKYIMWSIASRTEKVKNGLIRMQERPGAEIFCIREMVWSRQNIYTQVIFCSMEMKGIDP